MAPASGARPPTRHGTMALPIEDYGIIGDLHTAALVGRDGSIDWLCLPRFDSAACFAKLLGDEDHGRGSWPPRAPTAPPTATTGATPWCSSRSSSPTRGRSGSSTACPSARQHPEVVRLVEGVRGKVTMEMNLTIRFGYGQIIPWVRRTDGTLNAIAGPDGLSLWTPVDCHGPGLLDGGRVHRVGGPADPVLADLVPGQRGAPPPGRRGLSPSRTPSCGGPTGSSQCTYEGDYREAVVRSLITLKALTYEPTGGIVAAATTSLPEALGGSRNWDYRFCWLRDATLTLESLMRGGFYHEAMAWRNWLLRAIAGDPSQMQIMYGAAGERRLDEWEIDWLPGLRATRRRCESAMPPPASSSSTSTARSCRRSTSPSPECGDGSGTSPTWDLQLSLMDFLRGRLARTRRRHLGGAGPAPALHPLQGDGLGGHRPSHQDRRGARPRRTGRPWKEIRTGDPRPGVRRGLQRRQGLVHPVLRVRRARRQSADDPAGGLPARPRPAGARHHRGGGARAGRRGLRPAVPDRRHRRRRRAVRPRGGLPGLLVLVGRLPVPCWAATTTPASSSIGCSGCATTSACCPRSTTRWPDAWSATSPRPSPMCRWSTRRRRSAGDEKPTSNHVILGLAHRALTSGKSRGNPRHMGELTAHGMLSRLVDSVSADVPGSAARAIRAAVVPTAAPEGRRRPPRPTARSSGDPGPPPRRRPGAPAGSRPTRRSRAWPRWRKWTQQARRRSRIRTGRRSPIRRRRRSGAPSGPPLPKRPPPRRPRSPAPTKSHATKAAAKKPTTKARAYEEGGRRGVQGAGQAPVVGHGPTDSRQRIGRPAGPCPDPGGGTPWPRGHRARHAARWVGAGHRRLPDRRRAPVLVETGQPELGPGTAGPARHASASAPPTWPAWWSPTSTSIMPAASGTSPAPSPMPPSTSTRKGARHLADPTRLVDSAARVYGPLLDSLYGRLDPTPAERIHVLEDGEAIRVGPNRSLDRGGLTRARQTPPGACTTP